jgi:hypothetical protein
MSSPQLVPAVVKYQRETLARLGYSLVKVRTASKGAFEIGWQHPRNARTAEQWKDETASNDELNTGLLTHGMRAIDIDIDDPALAEYVVSACRSILGPAPRRYVDGRASCQLFYRSNKQNARGVKLPGTLGTVEARGNRQQSVIYGIHEESKQPYLWDVELLDIPRGKLTEVSDEQVQLFFNAIYQKIGAISPNCRFSDDDANAPQEQESIPIAETTERERAYARKALGDECSNLSTMGEGSHRNDGINEAAFTMGTMARWIDPKESAQAIYNAAIANGYVFKDGEQAAKKTIHSGISKGMKKHRPALDELDEEPIDLSNLMIGGRPVRAVLAALGVRDAALPSERLWPSPISDAAYIGIVGEFVRLVEPHTEGDAAGLLVAILTVLGSACGRSAWLVVGATHHYPNLFSVIVAETSKGRKGTVMAEAKRFGKLVDASMDTRMVSGLSSGEGLIEHVRDPREEDVPVKEGGKVTGHQRQVVDKGVLDKRLLVTEGEMGQALTVASREGNTLSATLRLAWDGETLQTLARSNKNVCKEPHIAIFGNITVEELQRLLTATDRANGFANRFLWVCARRSKELPFGGKVNEHALQALALRTMNRLVSASSFGQCGWMPDAAEQWQQVYSRLSAGKPGLAGAMSARAEAQTIRIALIYALLDGTNNIHASHLNAALAVWRYCEESTEYIFGSSLGDSTADEILRMLASKPEGATSTEINAHFGRNKSSDELRRALIVLQHASKIRSERRNTGGRPSEIWLRA